MTRMLRARFNPLISYGAVREAARLLAIVKIGECFLSWLNFGRSFITNEDSENLSVGDTGRIEHHAEKAWEN
jgi:hypothetical protein